MDIIIKKLLKMGFFDLNKDSNARLYKYLDLDILEKRTDIDDIISHFGCLPQSLIVNVDFLSKYGKKAMSETFLNNIFKCVHTFEELVLKHNATNMNNSLLPTIVPVHVQFTVLHELMSIDEEFVVNYLFRLADTCRYDENFNINFLLEYFPTTFFKYQELIVQRYPEVYRKLSIDLIKEHKDKFNWPMLTRNYNDLDKLIDNFPDLFDIDYVLLYVTKHPSYRYLSNLSFFSKHSDRIDWDKLVSTKALSEDVINAFQDKINWEKLYKNHAMYSNDFLARFHDKLDKYKRRLSVFNGGDIVVVNDKVEERVYFRSHIKEVSAKLFGVNSEKVKSITLDMGDDKVYNFDVKEYRVSDLTNLFHILKNTQYKK